MQYPALPKAAGEVALRALLDTVRPGGLLLAVYHDLDDEHRGHHEVAGRRSRGLRRCRRPGGAAGDDFSVELHAVEPRIDPPPDNPHISDESFCVPGAANHMAQSHDSRLTDKHVIANRWNRIAGYVATHVTIEVSRSNENPRC